MRNRIASVPVASVMVVSFSLLAVSPGLAQADLGGAPLDPYAAPRESGPLDPYAAASGPRMPPPVLLVAPPAPPPLQPAPVAPIDRYAAPGEYPPAAQYAPNPYAPGAGTCPAGCPQALPSLSTYHPTPPATERRPRYGLMSAGISIFTVSYVATASSAYYADRGELAIPLVGPIMTAIDLNRNDANRWDSAVPWATGALVFDALVQTAGLAMIIAGAVSKKTIVRRQSYTQPTLYPYAGGVTGTF